MITIEQAQSDKTLMDDFIVENMKLVGHAIKNMHLPLTEDYRQEGYIGLIKAAKYFDVNYGTSFSTYAIPLIQGEIRRYRRDREPISTVKVSRTIKDIYFKSIRLDSLADEEICQELNITQAELNDARLAMNPVTSLDMDIHINDSSGDKATDLYSILPSGVDLEEEVMSKLFTEEFLRNMESYSGKQTADIVKLYMSGLTQHKIGEKVNLSQVQVSRKLKKAVQIYKMIEGGELEMSIKTEDLLKDCRELGTDKAACMEIAKKYGLTVGTLRNYLSARGILKQLQEEKNGTAPKRTAKDDSYEKREAPSQQNVIKAEIIKNEHIEGASKDTPIGSKNIVTTTSAPLKVSALTVKAWGGKENTYYLEGNQIIIRNINGTLAINDISAMIQELQELAAQKIAV